MNRYNWKLHLKITVLISVIIYLMIAFTHWDITVIKELDNIEPVHRGSMIVVYLLAQAFIAMFVHEYPIKSNQDQ